MSKLSLWKANPFSANPWREMELMRRQMNEWMGGALPSIDLAWPENESLLSNGWNPRVEVADSADEIIVKAELPGMDKKDIQVSLENDLLTIQGEKKKESEVKEKNYVKSERYYGTFCRSFSLPSGVDSSKASANFNNGVLELKLPKKEEAKTKQVKIEVK